MVRLTLISEELIGAKKKRVALMLSAGWVACILPASGPVIPHLRPIAILRVRGGHALSQRKKQSSRAE